MTKEKLKQFRALKREIEMLSQKVYTPSNRSASDTVRGSLPSFPFTLHTVAISGYEVMDINISRRRNNRLQRLIRQRGEIEKFIDSIEDSVIRQVIELKYIDGLSWKDIAARQGGGNTEDGIRKACERFLRKT